MTNERLERLAELLIHHSLALQHGEHLLINCTPHEKPLTLALIQSAYAAGAYPHINMTDENIQRALIEGLQPEQAERLTEYEELRMRGMDAVISIRTAQNPMEMAHIPREKNLLWTAAANRWNKRQREGACRWCVCIYPTPLYAGMAGMSLHEFEDYYFRVCCMDYRRLGSAMEKLRKILEPADHVRILSPGTDLHFSILDIPKRVSAGDRNIPDGEVYTAPVRDSVNGTIAFNVPSIFQGKRFSGVRLTFRDGRAIKAEGTPLRELNEILDIDHGARYTGEFAFGLNPMLNVPIGLTLFDEKICGSIHIAMGNALDVTNNGNHSAIHWDLVSMHTPQMGGGEIYLDGVLLCKDGKFVLPELAELNSVNVP